MSWKKSVDDKGETTTGFGGTVGCSAAATTSDPTTVVVVLLPNIKLSWRSLLPSLRILTHNWTDENEISTLTHKWIGSSQASHTHTHSISIHSNEGSGTYSEITGLQLNLDLWRVLPLSAEPILPRTLSFMTFLYATCGGGQKSLLSRGFFPCWQLFIFKGWWANDVHLEA